MNAERSFVELLVYLCNLHIDRVQRDPEQDKKVVLFLREHSIISSIPEQVPPVSPTENDQRLLNVGEAAQLLGCSAKWIYVNYETLPHVALGTGPKPRLRFRRKALLAWIEQHEIDWRKKK